MDHIDRDQLSKEPRDFPQGHHGRSSQSGRMTDFTRHLFEGPSYYQGQGKCIVDKYRSHDVEQPSKAEASRHVDDLLQPSEELFRAFQEDFNTTIKNESEGCFMVESIFKHGFGGSHLNMINVDKGDIIGYNNNRFADNDWHFSKIIYLQLQLALKEAGMNISQFNLKRWYGINVSNDKTKSVALKILQEKQIVTVKKGSKEYDELVKAPTQKSKQYLLKDYPEAFLGKELTSITVIRKDDNRINIINEYS